MLIKKNTFLFLFFWAWGEGWAQSMGGEIKHLRGFLGYDSGLFELPALDVSKSKLLCKDT